MGVADLPPTALEYSRDVPAGAQRPASPSFALKSSPRRGHDARHTGELFLLTARDAAAGLNSCTVASLEESSGRGSTPDPLSSLH
jgi:hypothetical protein